jgi:hypothetical protein
MSLFTEGEIVTIKRMSSVIGNSMRVIPHVDGTIVVDIKEDYFYVIRNTGKTDATNSGIYTIEFVGLLDRLISLLVNRKLLGER